MKNKFPYLDSKSWELQVESGLPAGMLLKGMADPALLGVPPLAVAFDDEKVVGADMTCVCRRGNLRAWCLSSCGCEGPFVPLLTNSLKAPERQSQMKDN